MKRLSDADIDDIYNKTGWSSNPYGLQGLQLIQIELQLRTIDELKRLYGATH